MGQIFVNGIANLEKLLIKINSKKFMLVCDSSYPFLNIRNSIESVGVPFVIFNNFSSNPLHDDARKGLTLFFESGADTIVAVGGGSAMDVAKCIKLDSGLSFPIIAIPTTAGTGSESTRHIVVYSDGKKESLSSESVIPDYVIFEPGVLKTLPLYQKKCTLLDALCQGIESYWSVNATETTRKEYSSKAIKLITANMDKYILENDEAAAAKIMEGANFSGKAINITQTTAAHAMSYKLTSMYGLPHGHAVAICLPEVWSEMLTGCDDNQLKIFYEIAGLLGEDNPDNAIEKIRRVLSDWDISRPSAKSDWEKEIEELALSVNPIRLKNNPVQFDRDTLRQMYKRIVKWK